MSSTVDTSAEHSESPPEEDERISGSHRLTRILRRPEVGAAAAAIVIFAFFASTTDSFAEPAGGSTWLFTSSAL